MKNLSNIKIICENISSDYLKQTYLIHQDKLGENYLSYEHFENLAKQNLLLIAVENDEVLGYLTLEYSTEKAFFAAKNIDIPASDCPILILNTASVKYEGMKIGSKLVDFAIKNFSNNASKIYSPVWKNENQSNIYLLRKFGFSPLIELKNFWYEESIGIENYCPDCNTPCTCSLIVFHKNLK